MVPFPAVLAMPLQMKPRICFAFIAAAVLCWLMLSLLSTSIPRSLSARLLCSHTDPSLFWALQLTHPRCRTSRLVNDVSKINDILYLLYVRATLAECVWEEKTWDDYVSILESTIVSSNSRDFQSVLQKMTINDNNSCNILLGSYCSSIE